MTAGLSYTCGALLDGRLYCWGYNTYGNLGSGLPEDALVPVPVAVGRTFSSVQAGVGHACGIVDAVGYCWGDNTYWQLGDAAVTGTNAPVRPFDACIVNIYSHRCSLRPRIVSRRDGGFLELLAVAPGELLMPEGASNQTLDALAKHGVSWTVIPYGKMQLNGGGIHCSTTPLIRDPI